jgi:hypothetical protein
MVEYMCNLNMFLIFFAQQPKSVKEHSKIKGSFQLRAALRKGPMCAHQNLKIKNSMGNLKLVFFLAMIEYVCYTFT